MNSTFIINSTFWQAAWKKTLFCFILTCWKRVLRFQRRLSLLFGSQDSCTQTYDSEDVSFLANQKQTAFLDFSLACHWLQVFPRLSQVKWFSRACNWIGIFPPLPTVQCFPALADGLFFRMLAIGYTVQSNDNILLSLSLIVCS